MDSIKQLTKQKPWLVPLIIGILFYIVFFILFYKRIVSFIFFDEYANIMAGFFMLKGKEIYSQFFFNHQMLPVYLSYLLQIVLHPKSLYQLILYHRLFMYLFSVVFGLFLIYSMRWVGLGFVFVFELTKYYFFGNLFLAEAMIVYMIVYLFYLGWQKLKGVEVSQFALILSAIFTWFIIFSREPYVPLAILLYVVILATMKWARKHVISLGLFIGLSLITFLSVPIREYLFQVIYVNYITVFHDELVRSQSAGLGIWAVLFYPVIIFLKGQPSFVHNILELLSGVFLFSFVIFAAISRRWRLLLFIFIALAFANVRTVEPGKAYYNAFYLVQWYGICIASTFLLLSEMRLYAQKIYFYIAMTGMVCLLGFILFNPQYYLFKPFDKSHSFSFSFDPYYLMGSAINIMARPSSTLFVDMSDSILFWQAHTPPSYPWIVYYPVMTAVPSYRQERLSMFVHNPPDFYYINCNENISKNFYSLPIKLSQEYAPIKFNNSPTCFLVRKSLVSSLTSTQIHGIQSLGFSIAPEFLKKD